MSNETGGMTEAEAQAEIERIQAKHPCSDPRIQDYTLDEICTLALETLEARTREASAGNGAVEMREAAAKIIEGEVVHHPFRQWPWFGPGNEDRDNSKVKFCDEAAKAIRALPIPPAAKEEVTEEEVEAALAAYYEEAPWGVHGDKTKFMKPMRSALLAARKVRV